jgi:hypothetical protein
MDVPPITRPYLGVIIRVPAVPVVQVPPTVSFNTCPALGAIAGIGVKIVGMSTVSVVAVIVGKAAVAASKIVPLNGWNIIFLSHTIHPI